MANEPIDPLAASLPNAGPADQLPPRPWTYAGIVKVDVIGDGEYSMRGDLPYSLFAVKSVSMQSYPKINADEKLRTTNYVADVWCESYAAHIVKCVNSHDALTAENKMLREALESTQYWLGSQCPVLNGDTSDPCKLCGASEEKGSCRAFESTVPEKIAEAISSALSKSTGEK